MSSTRMGKPSLDSIAPRFVVGDMEQALAFYNQLGFIATIRDENFAVIECDGVALHLNASSEPQKRNSVCWIGVTNVEALHQQYMLKNVVQSTVDTKPWGMKEFSLRDPFRNLLLFAERVPEKMDI